MEVTEIKETIDALGKVVHEMRKKNDEHWAQVQKKGHSDPLLQEHVSRLSESVVALADTKERLERVETKLNRPALGGRGDRAGAMTERKAAFLNYLRKGRDMLTVDEVKLLSRDIDPQGGYWIDETLSSQIVMKVFETSPMRDVCTVETITSDALEIPEDINEVGAGWTTERAPRSETTTANIGMRRIPVQELYAEPKATQQLLDDAGIDVESWLATKIADKIGRIENLAFISGSGAGQPKGILTYPTSATPANPGQIMYAPSGHASQITADGLRNLFYSVKSPYLPNAVWLMKRSTVQTVSLLKDSQGRYIWEPGLQIGDPQNILGHQIHRMEDMPTIAANALPVAFGNFKMGYTIVDRQGIRVLRDPFTAKPFVLFYTTKRTGGDVTNFEAFAVLKIATS